MSGMRNVGVEYVEWARREKVGQENQERRASEVEKIRVRQRTRNAGEERGK